MSDNTNFFANIRKKKNIYQISEIETYPVQIISKNVRNQNSLILHRIQDNNNNKKKDKNKSAYSKRGIFSMKRIYLRLYSFTYLRSLLCTLGAYFTALIIVWGIRRNCSNVSRPQRMLQRFPRVSLSHTHAHDEVTCLRRCLDVEVSGC